MDHNNGQAQEFVRFREKTGAAYVNRTLIIPIIEASHATKGEVFDRLNTALKSAWKGLCKDKAFAERIFIAPIWYGGGVRCVSANDRPLALTAYRQPRITPRGESELGLALQCVARKLGEFHESGWFDEEYTQTVFLLFATGKTDASFAKSLDALQQKGRWHYGIKFAVALGEDADKDVLAAVTGNAETVCDEFGFYHGYEPHDSVAASLGFFLSMAGSYEKTDRTVMALDDGRRWTVIDACDDDASEAELRLVAKEDGTVAVVEVYGKTVSEFYTFRGEGLEQFESDRRNYHVCPECFLVRNGIVYVLWQTSHCNRKYAVLRRYRADEELADAELKMDELDDLFGEI